MDAVQGRVEVYMDGGVRQGTDVLKALAVGAKAVFIGRPVLWGLACKVLMWLSKLSSLDTRTAPQGEEGVAEVIKVLRDEFRTAMMLSGRWGSLISMNSLIECSSLFLQVVRKRLK